MLINTAWLLDYLSPTPSVENLRAAFIRAGLEIEETIDLKTALEPIVIGFVREVKPVEGAAGLFHCLVESKPGHIDSIVCTDGFPVEAGKGVPVAQVGTKLPEGKEITSAKIRGIESNGMICPWWELGVVSKEGMFTTTDESLIGKSLTSVTEIDQQLVDLSVLPNRPDCLGYIGIAREVAAILGLQVKVPSSFDWTNKHDIQGPVPVRIEEPTRCTRYVGQRIDTVKVGPSPYWLQTRLYAAGLRPINNVVDITNFVLLEYGQPLHAFDAKTLDGPEIIVRNMKKGESLELLNGTTLVADDIKLETLPLVIADKTRPVALAGIMGGKPTQTTTQTTSVFLEAACFDSVTIRKTARGLGISSDSSYRYERGTDPNSILTAAFHRAVALIRELTGGTANGSPSSAYPKTTEPRVIPLKLERVNSYLGIKLDAPIVQSELAKLGYKLNESLQVSVPTWRVDCNQDVVLIEDLARLIGYDSIPNVSLSGSLNRGGQAPLDALRSQLAAFMTANGFLECRTPPLVDASVASQFTRLNCSPAVVRNPIRADMSTVRQSLIPSLLAVAERNYRRNGQNYRFFELDRVMGLDGNTPVESWSLGGIWGDELVGGEWIAKHQPVDFLAVKGFLQSLFGAQLKLQPDFLEQPLPTGFVPGQSARIALGHQVLGYIGLVDRRQVQLDERLKFPIYGFELDLNLLLELKSGQFHKFNGMPKSQILEKDLSITVPASVNFNAIKAATIEAFSNAVSASTSTGFAPVCESLSLIDVYQGSPIPEGKKSVTLQLRFRDRQQTLTSDYMQSLLDSILKSLQSTFA